MSVRFKDLNDRICYVGAGLPNPASGFTLLMWIKVAVNTGTFATFARLSATGATSGTFATTITGIGGPIYATAAGALTGPGLIVANWYRYAVTGSAALDTLYLAHDLAGATSVVTGAVSSGGAANPNQISFGGRSVLDVTEGLNGNLAYPKLYGAVLTQAQIEAEWLSTTPLITANLAGFWPLTTHTDLTDHSGNGRHLSAGGTAPTTEDDPPISAPSTDLGAFLAFFG